MEETALSQLRLSDFTGLLASDAPAPGGGSTAALEGALGAALTAMVCALTEGRKKYAASQALVSATRAKAQALQAQFLKVMERDTRAFQAVSAVFAMPKQTPAERSARAEAMEQALRGCIETPLEMMELSAQALELAAALPGGYNTGAASDLGVAALSLGAAVRGAWLNVRINTAALADRAFAGVCNQKGQALLDRALPLCEQIYQAVLRQIDAS